MWGTAKCGHLREVIEFIYDNTLYPLLSLVVEPLTISTFQTMPAFQKWACNDDQNCQKYTMENFDEQFCNPEKLPHASSMTVLMMNCGQWPAAMVSAIVIVLPLVNRTS